MVNYKHIKIIDARNARSYINSETVRTYYQEWELGNQHFMESTQQLIGTRIVNE